MPIPKNANYINYSRFMQEIFMDSINVPVKLLREYEQMGLNERELVVLLRLLHIYYSRGRLDIGDVAADFCLNEEDAAALISPLTAKEIVVADEDGQGAYTLGGMFAQLYELWTIEKQRLKKNARVRAGKAETQKRHIAELAQLYRVFERELGRNLSPIENEKIGHWLETERQSPELITEALRRAVLHGKGNFAYIDKILLNWRQQGLRTASELAATDAAPPAKKAAKKPAAERNKDTWLDHYTG